MLMAMVMVALTCSLAGEADMKEVGIARMRSARETFAQNTEGVEWYRSTLARLYTGMLDAARKAEGPLVWDEGEQVPGDESEFVASKKEIVKNLRRYAEELDEHMLAIIAASEADESNVIRQRMMKSADITFQVHFKSDADRFFGNQNVGTTARSVGHPTLITVYGEKEQRAYEFFETVMTHELIHALVQSQVLSEREDGGISTRRHGKSGPTAKFADQQKILEGVTQYLTLKALRIMRSSLDRMPGDNPTITGSYFIETVFTVLMVSEYSEREVIEWFTGATPTRQMRWMATKRLLPLFHGNYGRARLVAEDFFMDDWNVAWLRLFDTVTAPEIMEGVSLFLNTDQDFLQSVPERLPWLDDAIVKSMRFLRYASSDLREEEVERLKGLRGMSERAEYRVLGLYWHYVTKERLHPDDLRVMALLGDVLQLDIEPQTMRFEWNTIMMRITLKENDRGGSALTVLAERMLRFDPKNRDALRFRMDAWLMDAAHRINAGQFEHRDELSVRQDVEKLAEEAKAIFAGRSRSEEIGFKEYLSMMRVSAYAWMGGDEEAGRWFLENAFTLLKRADLSSRQHELVRNVIEEASGMEGWQYPYTKNEYQEMNDSFRAGWIWVPEENRRMMELILEHMDRYYAQ